MATRRKARETAFQMLFQIDVNPEIDPETVRVMIHEQVRSEPLRQFAWELFSGVMEFRSDESSFNHSNPLKQSAD